MIPVKTIMQVTILELASKTLPMTIPIAVVTDLELQTILSAGEHPMACAKRGVTNITKKAMGITVINTIAH
jgi:hypothetical protein